MPTTIRQHYVPVAYLKHWENNAGRLVVYDLPQKKSFQTTPENVLNERFLYENDKSMPDNRIENRLSEIESQMAPILDQLSSIKINLTINDKKISKNIQRIFTVETQAIIKKFLLCQYLRIPGALDQKIREAPEHLRDALISQGEFLESGFHYIKNRFFSMQMLINFSKTNEFITSDWPCFEMMDSSFSPALGEEIGINPGVIAYFPITPKICAIVYPKNFEFESAEIHEKISKLSIGLRNCIVNKKAFKDEMIKNANELVIQQAHRFVVSREEKAYILEHASTRLKNCW